MLPGERDFFPTDYTDIYALCITKPFNEYEVVTDDDVRFFDETGSVSQTIEYAKQAAPCIIRKWHYALYGPPKLLGEIGYNGPDLFAVMPMAIRCYLVGFNPGFLAKLFNCSDDRIKHRATLIGPIG